MIYRFSALGRPLDFHYKTNLVISIITAASIAASFLLFLLYESNSFLDSVIDAVRFGLSLFLSWALAREIDPDNDLSAFPAVAVTFGWLFFFSFPNLLFLFWSLLILRLVNQIVGNKASLPDLVIITLFALYFAYSGLSIFLFITFLAAVLDSVLQIRNRKSYYFAIFIFILFIYSLFSSAIFLDGEFFVPVLVAILLFIPKIFSSKQFKSYNDLNTGTVFPLRIQSAQVLFLLMVLSVIFTQISLIEIFPLLGVAFSVSIYFYIKYIFGKFISQD